MQNYFDSPIFVLGLPRSGTSMTAGLLHICGAWVGTTVPGGGEENPKGFFEHVVLREKVVKQILSTLECDPLGVKKLPDMGIGLEITNLAEFVRLIIEKDGYDHSRPWLYKGAKLTLLWPIFRKSFPAARWVIVRRNEEDIIKSCLRTYFMNQHSTDYGFWKNFVNEYLTRLDALKKSGATCYEINSEDIISGNLDPFRTLTGELGLQFREQEVTEFTAPAHWHGSVDSG